MGLSPANIRGDWACTCGQPPPIPQDTAGRTLREVLETCSVATLSLAAAGPTVRQRSDGLPRQARFFTTPHDSQIVLCIWRL